MYRNILVPVDVNDPGSWAKTFPVAVSMCQAFGASLTLGTVVPDFELMLEAQFSPISFREFVDSARERLAVLANTIEGAGKVACRVETGGVHAGVLAIAEHMQADLILLASHRPAIRDYLLGSNAARVVLHAKCSVLVVRDTAAEAHG